MSEHQAEVIIQLLEALYHSLAGLRQELVEIKQQPSLVNSVKRIRHFATGSCDMPLETRLKCIAKECEASLSKFDAEWREAQGGVSE
jgi:hypothetical protein